MQKIDKEKFIKDIKQDLGIKERKDEVNFETGTFEGFGGLEEIFTSFFGNDSSKDNKNELDNPNNIVIDYWVDAKTSKTEHTKTFKYKINNNGVTEKKKIEINIPAYIRTGQIILVRGEGNKDINLLGNLIIKIHLKH